MPELDAERREALHQRLKESPGCYEGESCCLDSLDSITPLVAGWLAEAEAGALREAAERWREYEFVEVEWLRDRADRTGEPT